MNLEASDAMLLLEVLPVLVPFQSGSRVSAGVAPKLHRLTGRDGVKLLFHFVRVNPQWGHCLDEEEETKCTRLHKTTEWKNVKVQVKVLISTMLSRPQLFFFF